MPRVRTHASNDVLASILFLPIAVNEMVFTLWLISRGFDPEALDRLFPPEA